MRFLLDALRVKNVTEVDKGSVVINRQKTDLGVHLVPHEVRAKGVTKVNQGSASDVEVISEPSPPSLNTVKQSPLKEGERQKWLRDDQDYQDMYHSKKAALFNDENLENIKRPNIPTSQTDEDIQVDIPDASTFAQKPSRTVCIREEVFILGFLQNHKI